MLKNVIQFCTPLVLTGWLVGCGGGTADVEGGILEINGQVGDTILVQRAPTVPDSLLCCSPAQGCRSSTMVRLDEDGRVEVRRLVVPSGYAVFSNETGCFDFVAELPCRGRTPVFCFPPPEPVQSLGTIVIDGPGVDCVSQGGLREICNNTWVNVTINGYTVSSRALANSTSSSVAWDLATKINGHPDLGPLVGATVSSNVVNVFARQEGVEYSYPWDESCVYLESYFPECAYHAKLSPIATLAPR